MYKRIHMHTRTHTHIHTRKHTRMHARTHTHIHTHTHTNRRTHTYTHCKRTYTNTHCKRTGANLHSKGISSGVFLPPPPSADMDEQQDSFSGAPSKTFAARWVRREGPKMSHPMTVLIVGV